jgi:hypothetical protein
MPSSGASLAALEGHVVQTKARALVEVGTHHLCALEDEDRVARPMRGHLLSVTRAQASVVQHGYAVLPIVIPN